MRRAEPVGNVPIRDSLFLKGYLVDRSPSLATFDLELKCIPDVNDAILPVRSPLLDIGF